MSVGCQGACSIAVTATHGSPYHCNSTSAIVLHKLSARHGAVTLKILLISCLRTLRQNLAFQTVLPVLPWQKAQYQGLCLDRLFWTWCLFLLVAWLFIFDYSPSFILGGLHPPQEGDKKSRYLPWGYPLCACGDPCASFQSPNQHLHHHDGFESRPRWQVEGRAPRSDLDPDGEQSYLSLTQREKQVSV